MNNYTLLNETFVAPMVSVAMLAYNHEKFIAKAIESVLMQQTDFRVQLVIAEDCSTDNTRKILLDYQQRFPERIKLILQHKNVGAQANNLVLLNNLDGKYIAALECDDYWTHPQKLQKQIDYLEAHPDCTLCFHDAKMVYENNNVPDKLFSEMFGHFYVNREFSQGDIIKNDWFIATPTMVFRKDAYKRYDWMEKVYSGDYSLHLVLTENGYAYYLPEMMAVVRKHEAGVSQTKNSKHKMERSIAQQKVFAEYVGTEYEKVFNKRVVAIAFSVVRSPSFEYGFGFRMKCLSDMIKYLF